jgi:AcrR family transcriptional regulator
MKSFTEQERNNINEKLIYECSLSWQKYGYKKTNINDLCAKAGISKGAFYLFYDTKESLFIETIKTIQQTLYYRIEQVISQNQSKYGVAEALKEIYREYSKSNFLYNTTDADFLSFFNKLTKEEQQKISTESYVGAKIMLNKPFLKLKINEEKALSIFSTLLSIVSHKEQIKYNHFEVFDFMIDNLIDKILE